MLVSKISVNDMEHIQRNSRAQKELKPMSIIEKIKLHQRKVIISVTVLCAVAATFAMKQFGFFDFMAEKGIKIPFLSSSKDKPVTPGGAGSESGSGSKTVTAEPVVPGTSTPNGKEPQGPTGSGSKVEENSGDQKNDSNKGEAGKDVSENQGENSTQQVDSEGVEKDPVKEDKDSVKEDVVNVAGSESGKKDSAQNEETSGEDNSQALVGGDAKDPIASEDILILQQDPTQKELGADVNDVDNQEDYDEEDDLDATDGSIKDGLGTDGEGIIAGSKSESGESAHKDAVDANSSAAGSSGSDSKEAPKEEKEKNKTSSTSSGEKKEQKDEQNSSSSNKTDDKSKGFFGGIRAGLRDTFFPVFPAK